MYTKWCMKRTQIYFPIDLYQAIETRAKQQGVSVSEVIRQTMQKNLVKTKPEFLLTKLIRNAKPGKGEKYLSRDYKKILYGA